MSSDEITPLRSWILVLPDPNNLYLRQLGQLAQELRLLGHRAFVFRKVPTRLEKQDIVFSINLQGASGARGFAHHVSWIQDPAPGLHLSRIANSADTTLLFLGGAVAQDCGFPDGKIFLPGLTARRTVDRGQRSNIPTDYRVVLGNFFDLSNTLGIPAPTIMNLVRELYEPLQGALRVDTLMHALAHRVTVSECAQREMRHLAQCDLRGFEAQRVGANELSRLDPTLLPRGRVNALVWLAVNVPRILDREELVKRLEFDGFPTYFFGRGWELLNIDPLRVKGPMHRDPSLNPQIAMARWGVHANTHGLVAHPTVMGYLEQGIPVITHDSPFSKLGGGLSSMHLPRSLVRDAEDLSIAGAGAEEQAQWGNREAVMKANSWNARAKQLVAIVHGALRGTPV